MAAGARAWCWRGRRRIGELHGKAAGAQVAAKLLPEQLGHVRRDIAFEEVGLRPGEKLIEELLIGGDCEGTAHPRIVKARECMLSWPTLDTQLRKLMGSLDDADSEAAIAILRELVPEFRPPVGEAKLAVADVHELQPRVVRGALGGV